MPSPVGHALGGIAAGWVLIPCEARQRHPVPAAAALAALAVAPDLDLLVHAHRGPTHSLGAALLAGLAVFAVTRSPRWGIAAAAAWSSHVLLDWLGTDTRPPFGLMALWPVSRAYFESTLHIFPAISRRYWLAEFWYYNLKALAVELCVMVPVTWLVIALSRRWEKTP
jgi:membrane-bound metal-dependent hydrolase YbcI (DUF457 family)